jgi:hypothetical protein
MKVITIASMQGMTIDMESGGLFVAKQGRLATAMSRFGQRAGVRKRSRPAVTPSTSLTIRRCLAHRGHAPGEREYPIPDLDITFFSYPKVAAKDIKSEVKVGSVADIQLVLAGAKMTKGPGLVMGVTYTGKQSLTAARLSETLEQMPTDSVLHITMLK